MADRHLFNLAGHWVYVVLHVGHVTATAVGHGLGEQYVHVGVGFLQRLHSFLRNSAQRYFKLNSQVLASNSCHR